MDIGLVSLILLFAVIVIGFWRKTNVGVLAIAAAAVLAYATGQFTGKEVVSGFSSSLFMTMLGVTLLFGIIQANGCLEILMKKIVRSIGTQVWIIPILLFIIGWVLSAIGPGCVPILAVVAMLAVPLAHESGYDPVMLMMIGDMGTYSGRFTKISPEGILVGTLMGDQGFTDVSRPMVMNTMIGAVLLAVIIFFAFKGYRVKAGTKVDESEIKEEKLTSKQIISLLSILVMLAGVIFLKMDVGLASFIVAAVLIAGNIGDQSAAFKNVPWNTLIMITGVGVLMKLVISTGGIDILASAMSSVMTKRSAPAVAALAGGCMSWFSSAAGVVLPTLVPTIGQLVANVPGASPMAIVSAIGIAASCAGLSPASTGGALILGSIGSDPVFSKQIDSNKLFIKLFAWSVFCVAFLAVLAYLGVIGIFS